MTTITRQDGPTSPPKLQQILDLEHKFKMERLQGSPEPSCLSLPTLRHDTSSRHGSLTVTSADRSSSNVSKLTILIPPSTTTIPPIEKSRDSSQSELRPQTPAQHSQKIDNVVDNKGDEEKSDSASSICHSPSWEGYGQRKKEKKAETKQRRKDKDQTEKNPKHNTKKSVSTAKLTKPPPSASRSADNSKADRDLESGRSGRTSAQVDQYPPSASRPHHKRRRSSSVASQIRAVFSGLKTKEKEKEKEREKEVGFIGGLKLEKEREAARKAAEDAAQGDRPHLESRENSPSSPPHTSQPNTPGTQTPRQSRVAAPISTISLAKAETPSSPISPAAQESAAATTEYQDSYVEKYSALVDESQRGRQGGSYVQNQRQQSRDRAIVAFRDETLVSARSHYPPLARRPQHVRSYSFNSETNSQGATGVTPSPRADASAESSPRSNYAQSSASQSFAAQPARSPATGSATTKSFRNSMQAALHKFKPTPDKLPSPHDNSDLDRASSSAIPTPNSTACSDLDRGALGPGHPQIAGGKNDVIQMVKAHDVARPSSSSSSCCDDSFRSSSIVTTPDSFRPQSDENLPPVLNELRKGRLGGHPRAEWDRKGFPGSQRSSWGASGPMSPRSILAPTTLKNEKNIFREGGHEKAEKAVQRDRKAIVVKRGREGRDSGSESFRTCLLPVEVTGSKAALVPAPLEITPVSSLKESSRAASDSQTTLSTEPEPERNDRSTTLQRILSQPKRRSTNSVDVGIASSQEKNGGRQPVPPPRSQARGTPGTYTSSVSLADAIPSISVPGRGDAPRSPRSPRSPDPSASLSSEAAGRSVPASIPVPLRTSRMTSSRKEGGTDPLAKILVECCHCKFFHDMPSRVYECMVRPHAEVADPALGVSGAITTMVNCPWCKHGMTTQCCAGYAAVVYLKERLH
ncbi:hypothetical protein SODALDRAFT_329206 [Sodiomyces alkalinus F11]|uniref:Uncharacterized protein n=1 Tax=Sodiomyces alkalinus (strain CBS 110278 / VKM F-3762 / F11) TaxID=1314773 RepID=A0A3N2PKE5_SODAK|nr:hypothetical protein SODALDRAFT_329206 [Sodiomyces alkalinus F11]ROT34997.1 hypothetical protein SODALDRAFT_329206 [Sodiomyces alkalinus F11]